MTFTRIQMLAAVCFFSFPLGLVAQAAPNDPTAPTSANPGMNNSNSPMGAPSTTSGQTTPGVTRQNPNGPGNYNSEAAGPMGTVPDTSIADKRFLTEATEGGMAEIQLGQLASSKANNAQVKAYGQRMVTDHTILNNNLKPFADKDGITPPTSLNAADQAEYDKLNGLSGADFDKEYVAFMMKDHKKDESDFRHEASMTSNPQLKIAVSKGEKVISEHKQMIDKIGASMNVSPSI